MFLVSGRALQSVLTNCMKQIPYEVRHDWCFSVQQYDDDFVRSNFPELARFLSFHLVLQYYKYQKESNLMMKQCRQITR